MRLKSEPTKAPSCASVSDVEPSYKPESTRKIMLKIVDDESLLHREARIGPKAKAPRRQRSTPFRRSRNSGFRPYCPDQRVRNASAGSSSSSGAAAAGDESDYSMSVPRLVPARATAAAATAATAAMLSPSSTSSVSSLVSPGILGDSEHAVLASVCTTARVRHADDKAAAVEPGDAALGRLFIHKAIEVVGQNSSVVPTQKQIQKQGMTTTKQQKARRFLKHVGTIVVNTRTELAPKFPTLGHVRNFLETTFVMT